MFTHLARSMSIAPRNTALVLTDMQNDFLSPQGGAYPLIAESLAANDVPANLEKLLRAAKKGGYGVFVSPHYYYPHDHDWQAPATPMEDFAHEIGLLNRVNALSLEGFRGSGADFPERYKPYIEDGKTVVTSPHKAYSASTNDLVLQLRRHGIEKVILAGPVGNLCVEGHMRDLIENGFEIAVVRDATAGARNEEGHGYLAAMVNWRFLAHALWSTAETTQRMAATA